METMALSDSKKLAPAAAGPVPGVHVARGSTAHQSPQDQNVGRACEPLVADSRSCPSMYNLSVGLACERAFVQRQPCRWWQL
jgi:hypothetical protein